MVKAEENEQQAAVREAHQEQQRSGDLKVYKQTGARAQVHSSQQQRPSSQLQGNHLTSYTTSGREKPRKQAAQQQAQGASKWHAQSPSTR